VISIEIIIWLKEARVIKPCQNKLQLELAIVYLQEWL